MTEEQLIHISMINSFNVITGRNNPDEIMDSAVSVFAHIPKEDPPFELIEMMIEYFTAFEMFEKCFELSIIMREMYTPDGKPREQLCECTLPEIVEYSRKMVCGYCNKKLKK